MKGFLNTKTRALLHKRFAVHSCQGEWFRLRGRLKRWIAEGCPP
jgi:hypothetical protein